MGNAPSDGSKRKSCSENNGHRQYEVRVAATEILRIAGVSAYHTSVILDSKEYFFDSLGIVAAPALWSHLVGQARREEGLRTEVLDVGRSSHGPLALAHVMRPWFEKGSYDVLYKNCNSFTDATLYFLTGGRLEGRFSRLESMLIATDPVSTGLLNRLLKASIEYATGESALEDHLYVTNPLAKEFSIDEFIASCDAQEEDSYSDVSESVDAADSDSDHEIHGRCMPTPRCCNVKFAQRSQTLVASK